MKGMIRGMFLAAFVCGIDVAAAFGQTTFSDDFNRPDSPAVGNGWSDTTDNVGGNLSIQNDQVISNEIPDVAGIYRPFSFTSPVSIQTTLFGTDDLNASGD